ncbi:uracil-DNA glycosylase [Aestuariivirga sp.]|uniref:uracil-DNA glycosylase n=1 Tax=Aestuariivirga sp. TaxID=2650926 RepID=UPI0025C6C407|nr:uracil-DNA glycosylase [Aestuariivirga sp.]
MPISDSRGDEPGRDCPLCPRLVQYRHEQRKLHPDWFNAPVPAFGGDDARLLIAGLAPGVAGANRTGRPFTGDYAGELLYGTLIHFGFAKGVFRADPKDGLTLSGTMIANAVRCVPPQNKPLPIEIKNCNGFLRARMDALPRLKAVVALGRIAHDGVLTALTAKKSAHPFSHGCEHQIGDVRLFDSYHCSRYNTNTGVLTQKMFRAVFGRVREYLDSL